MCRRKFKRNIINNDLHRASIISSDMDSEMGLIRKKYTHVGYVEIVIKKFNEKNRSPLRENVTNEQQKAFIPVRIPYCENNEAASKTFLNKLNQFANNNFEFTIVWNTRKIRSLFKLKEKSKSQSCVIYEGASSNDVNIKYIGETKFIAEIRWNQHNNPSHNSSSPANYLKNNRTDKFNWKVLCKTSKTRIKERFTKLFTYQSLNHF